MRPLARSILCCDSQDAKFVRESDDCDALQTTCCPAFNRVAMPEDGHEQYECLLASNSGREQSVAQADAANMVFEVQCLNLKSRRYQEDRAAGTLRPETGKDSLLTISRSPLHDRNQIAGRPRAWPVAQRLTPHMEGQTTCS